MAEVVIRPPSKPTYGIDAPHIVVGLSAAAAGAVLIGFFMAAGRGPAMGAGPWSLAAVLAIAAVWVVLGTKRAKPRLWRSTLDALALEGTEQTLDLGCGTGLVLIETAKRLPVGHATGVDIWRSRDQSGNRRITTELNARVEGVADRVTIHDADITRLPFADRTFDLVTASFSIRSLPLADERSQVIDQIARVLRPGGRVAILDDAYTAELVDHLTSAGFTGVTRSAAMVRFGRPARLIAAARG